MFPVLSKGFSVELFLPTPQLSLDYIVVVLHEFDKRPAVEHTASIHKQGVLAWVVVALVQKAH